MKVRGGFMHLHKEGTADVTMPPQAEIDAARMAEHERIYGKREA